MGVLSNYFDLRKSFPFYGAYHNEGRNQLIHVVWVPVIYLTSMHFLSYLPMGQTGFSVADLISAVYAVSFIKMEPVAGLAYAPVIAAMNHVGTRVMQRPEHTKLAVALHVAGWFFQIALGHAVFERRKPAVLDNLVQSVHAAVFFVWLEVLFFFGYRPELKAELQRLVDERIAESKKQA